MKTVFVYGTLKSDGPLNESWLSAGCELIYPFASVPGYTLVNMGNAYPVAIRRSSDIANVTFCVRGEVWRIPDELYNSLSAMETGAGYTVKQVVVNSFESEQRMINGYFQQADDHTNASMFIMNVAQGFDSTIQQVSLSMLRDVQAEMYIPSRTMESRVAWWNNSPTLNRDGTPRNVILTGCYNNLRPEDQQINDPPDYDDDDHDHEDEEEP